MTPDLAGRLAAIATLALLFTWLAWERTEYVPRWQAIEMARAVEDRRG